MVSSHQRHHPHRVTETPQRTMAAETPRRAMAWRDGFVPVVGLTAGVGNRVAESQVYHGDTEFFYDGVTEVNRSG